MNPTTKERALRSTGPLDAKGKEQRRRQRRADDDREGKHALQETAGTRPVWLADDVTDQGGRGGTAELVGDVHQEHYRVDQPQCPIGGNGSLGKEGQGDDATRRQQQRYDDGLQPKW